MSRLKILLSLVPLLGAAACGGEPQDEKVQYYVVDDGGSSARSGDGNPAPTPDDDKSGDASPLKLTFVSPSEATDGGGTINVVVSFAGAADDDTWSLSYATTADATAGTPIQNDVPVATTAVDWDTSGLTPGAYYLIAELNHDGAAKLFHAKAAVTVAKPGPGPVNKKPTVKLDFPNGENVVVAGTPAKIAFTGADGDGDALKYKIEYSADGGVTWAMIAKDVTAATYDWDPANLVQGITYRVKVTAEDGKGGTGSAVSAKNFGVATKAMTFAAGFGDLMKGKCDSCHKVGGPNANVFRSDNFALATIGVDDKAQNIKNRIDNGTMPPNAPLGAPDRAVLTMWMWSGAQ